MTYHKPDVTAKQPKKPVGDQIKEHQQKATDKTLQDAFYRFYRDWLQFSFSCGNALLDAGVEAYRSFVGTPVYSIKPSKIQNKTRAVFDSKLQDNLYDDKISYSLAALVDSWLDLIKSSGFNKYYDSIDDYFINSTKRFETVRGTIDRTPSDTILLDGGIRLHRYHNSNETQAPHRTPILVVYSLINRFYILDLVPNHSVVRNLLDQGFDVYSTDWGTPSTYDKDMDLEKYAHDYIGNAIDKIREITGSEKVTLFGYCWGGVFSIIYASKHPEKIKNLVLHATPVDYSRKKGVVENWTSHIDTDKLVDVLGNVPEWFINMAFVLRNPVEVILKYPLFFSNPRSIDEIRQFFWIETWLYDSRPIFGEAYREMIGKICKKNLLVKNQMKVGNHDIDLRKVTMPVMSIVGTKDDLIPSSVSKPIHDVISSKDQKIMEFPTGHVGLCVSSEAHEKLWPQVGEWLASRS